MNAPVVSSRKPLLGGELEPLLAVLFMMIDELRSVVIHITATNHGEGTTSIARQLAVGAAASGWCKIALVDACPGHISPLIAPTGRPGLIDYFERGEEPTLRLSRIGSVQLSTNSLTGDGRPVTRVESVRGLYGFLRSNFNLVVVDCPPVLTGHHAASLASVADGTLLVVEAERTRAADVNRTRETLEQLGATILGVVLNKRRQRIPKFLGRLI